MGNFKLNNKRIKQIVDRIIPKKQSKVLIKEMGIRDMVRLARRPFVYEQDGFVENDLTPKEIEDEKTKFENVFNENDVIIEFNDLISSNKGVLWSGTIDNQIQWAFRVTADQNSSGIDINFIEGFDQNDPDNKEIIKKLENYYHEFYTYWRNNLLNVDKVE